MPRLGKIQRVNFFYIQTVNNNIINRKLYTTIFQEKEKRKIFYGCFSRSSLYMISKIITITLFSYSSSTKSIKYYQALIPVGLCQIILLQIKIFKKESSNKKSFDTTCDLFINILQFAQIQLISLKFDGYLNKFRLRTFCVFWIIWGISIVFTIVAFIKILIKTIVFLQHLSIGLDKKNCKLIFYYIDHIFKLIVKFYIWLLYISSGQNISIFMILKSSSEYQKEKSDKSKKNMIISIGIGIQYSLSMIILSEIFKLSIM